ncbi:hypothetical protein CEXT_680131 [Caerostris extrusa]|uniref:Uncharacterized protein n=1 Tax=Caerostris extrusa TaxID=172846 RepID=A0AAV4PAM4_CAEEX|nr:hypothetical protein CEXT_680131 [Caerostris extrusa]
MHSYDAIFFLTFISYHSYLFRPVSIFSQSHSSQYIFLSKNSKVQLFRPCPKKLFLDIENSSVCKRVFLLFTSSHESIHQPSEKAKPLGKITCKKCPMSTAGTLTTTAGVTSTNAIPPPPSSI